MRRGGRRSTKEDNVLSQHHDAAREQAAPGTPHMMAQPDANASDALLAIIRSALENEKAEDIVEISLSGKSEMADYMIICSGRSTRQVSAISDKLVDKLKTELGRSSKVEGKESGDWVLIDTGDVIVHLFRPEVREFYQLEKMWLTPGAAQAGQA